MKRKHGKRVIKVRSWAGATAFSWYAFQIPISSIISHIRQVCQESNQFRRQATGCRALTSTILGIFRFLVYISLPSPCLKIIFALTTNRI